MALYFTRPVMTRFRLTASRRVLSLLFWVRRQLERHFVRLLPFGANRNSLRVLAAADQRLERDRASEIGDLEIEAIGLAEVGDAKVDSFHVLSKHDPVRIFRLLGPFQALPLGLQDSAVFDVNASREYLFGFLALFPWPAVMRRCHIPSSYQR